MATPGSWTLGISPGVNTLEARITGLPAATFTATGTNGGGGFSIEVRFLSGLSPTQQAIFDQAVARWQAVITGDLPDVSLNIGAGACGEPSIPSTSTVVDDLLIFAQGTAIDGVGRILGQAGPCSVRSSGLPIYGRMRFDQADLDELEVEGRLLDVVIHEIGHVLGFGSLWNFGPFSLLSDEGGPDPFFTGANALTAFNSVGGAAYTGNPVPVENTGGPGTADSHWREFQFKSELMTVFIERGTNPLSVVTIGSLADMGFVVDAGVADAYVLAPPLAPSREEAEARPPLRLHELPMPPPVIMGPDGTVLGRVRGR